MASWQLTTSQPFKWARLLLTDPACRWKLIALVVVGDALLTQLILRLVSYTEIDWETYMYHIELYIKGERNYAAITGPTGPLVYPAGHVHIHRALYAITSSGLNIPRAQQLYGVLYLISLALTCAIYDRAGGIPNWIILLLPLSKRLHSIYALRLFNDCWAAVALQAAIISYGQGWDGIATLLFSAALSVKMSILLYLPGVLLVLWKRHGPLVTARHVVRIVATQVILALPFLTRYPREYLSGAFDLSRVFLFKWSVNWRFLGEDAFLNPLLARALLVGHVFTLVAFAVGKWCRKDGGAFALLWRGLRRPSNSPSSRPVSADYVTTVLMTCNLIGILFARSLHYQFYSWYAQQLPLLLWRTPFPVPVKLATLVCVEYSWNVFPSSTLSSALLVSANALVLTGIWFGWPEGKDIDNATVKKSK